MVAAADPAHRSRRRTEIVRYLRLQGGVIRDERGLVTRHLRAALWSGPGIDRVLRGMERDGLVVRDVRGRRTYAVALAGHAAGSTATDTDADAGAADGTGFVELVDALLAIMDKRLAVADPENRSRIAALEDGRAEVTRLYDTYRELVARGDAAAEHAFVERALETMTANALAFETRTGFRIDDAFTASEHRTLQRLVSAAARST